MSDHDAYRRFTRKGEFEKSVNSLLGLIEGIAIDSKINDNEIQFLQLWLDDHRIRADKHPFSELFPVVGQAISDGILTEGEKADITWLCNKLTSSEYFNAATADMQKLHAVLAAVASDGKISVEELKGISAWFQEHEHLKRCWPYDEVESLITSILVDKEIDPEEHKMLMDFFGEFVSILDNKTVVSPAFLESSNIVGLCAVCSEIAFADAVFCLTGTSHKYTRGEFEAVIEKLGGVPISSVTKSLSVNNI